MEERSDPEMVMQALAGSQEAFGRLVERYHPAVSSLAARMVWNPEAARELVQEAFLQAFLSLPKLRHAARFKSWLYGIVINLCRGYLRDQRLAFLSLEALAGELDGEERWADTRAQDPQEASEAQELSALLAAAVQALPASQREAVLRFYYYRQSIAEIARELGLTTQAVKVRLHRARRLLRLELLHSYPEIGNQVTFEQRRGTMIAVKIVDVVILDNHSIVLLLDEAGDRLLPIWIGEVEALAIAMGLLNFQTQRPMTYTFMAQTLAALGATLEEARVEALKENTFYGTARLRRNGSVQEVDARPSDVLALAQRTGTPIYVGEEVMESAGMELHGQVAHAKLSGQGAAELLEKFNEMTQKFLPKSEPGPSWEEKGQALLDLLMAR